MHKKRFPIILIVCALLLLAIKLHAKSNEKFFSRTMLSTESVITVEDSTIISIYLFATKPIGDILISPEIPEGDNCKIRLLYLNKQGRRQAITQLEGKNYYTILCAQYSVRSEKKGKYFFPKLSIDANLYIEQEPKQTDDPFIFFFGQRSFKKEKVSTCTESTKIEITTPPAKTAEQLRQMGKIII